MTYADIIESEGSFLLCEPSSWGGQWTEEKLDAFEKKADTFNWVMG